LSDITARLMLGGEFIEEFTPKKWGYEIKLLMIRVTSGEWEQLFWGCGNMSFTTIYMLYTVLLILPPIFGGVGNNPEYHQILGNMMEHVQPRFVYTKWLGIFYG